MFARLEKTLVFLLLLGPICWCATAFMAILNALDLTIIPWIVVLLPMWGLMLLVSSLVVFVMLIVAVFAWLAG